MPGSPAVPNSNAQTDSFDSSYGDYYTHAWSPDNGTVASNGQITLTSPSVTVSSTATLGGSDEVSLWNRIASVLPLLALVAGLVVIQQVQTDSRANELAEVDAALLTDDLPPAAYADPGFVQFLKSGRE